MEDIYLILLNVYFRDAVSGLKKADAHVSLDLFQTRPDGQSRKYASPHKSHWMNFAGSGCGKNSLLAAMASCVHGLAKASGPVISKYYSQYHKQVMFLF